MRWFALMCAAPVLLGLILPRLTTPLHAEPPAGFVPLFNGKDLTGWQGHVTMAERHKITDKTQLEELIRKRTDTAFKHWTVKDGVIYCDGQGGVSLQTVKDYGNFELLVDWKIAPKGDSGIYLRGQPQVQIWDSDNLPDNLQADRGKGSGGLWNNPPNDPAKQPLVKADKPVGEWNTFHIILVGDQVTVKLNGKTVVDKGKLYNYWFKNQPVPDKGPIELQIHGTPLWFRNIYIKELP
ncbi:MAG: DUF1080 domain-containing protein [Gemmataceae bacterium]|nr:DUF1080 domain-containing protein [Gemmataceae bacterium]MDW8242754.1 DUF1080 domain-containing protein [Thermogemmata sp.]